MNAKEKIRVVVELVLFGNQNDRNTQLSVIYFLVDISRLFTLYSVIKIKYHLVNNLYFNDNTFH